MYSDDTQECLMFFEECLKRAEKYNQWQKGRSDFISVIKHYKNAIKEVKSVLNKMSY